MWLLAWRRLRHRGARTLVMAFAILVAATGFTVLTASSDAARLETVGQVKEAAPATYDVLVRPKGARSRYETAKGEVQPGFLSGIYGGISLKQWRQIQRLSGVEVAAPIAMLGAAYPAFTVPVDTQKAWSKTGTSVARVDVSWAGDNGLTVTEASPDYAITTDKPLPANRMKSADDGFWSVTKADGTRQAICPHSISEDPRPESKASWLYCFSRTSGGQASEPAYDARFGYTRYHYLGVTVPFALPYVIAAVDPASEDALVGLDSARTSGKPLSNATGRYPAAYGGHGLPVLASTEFDISEDATITVSRLPAKARRDVLNGANADALKPYAGRVISSQKLSAEDVQALFFDQLRTAEPYTPIGVASRGLPGEVTQLVQADAPTFQQIVQGLRVHLSPSPVLGVSTDPRAAAPASDEPVARATRVVQGPHVEGSIPPAPATLRLRGTFDPARLAHVGDLTDKTLAGYATARSDGVGAASAHALGDKPLLPSTSAAGLVQPAPTMITTLKAAVAQLRDWSGFSAAAPISAIRVRVAGASVYNEAARERIRLVADRIHRTTGLDVDITTGASTTSQTIVLPAGIHGRPQLTLRQAWVKLGVATTIINAVDKKSLFLFVLVLLVSACSIANAAIAVVRARRIELGVLACLGWRRSALFRTVLYELGGIAVGAGAVSVVLSLALAAALGTPVSLARALLALPAALLVALLAGAAPALLAARADPMDAVQPVGGESRKPRHARSVITLAALNLQLNKSRTVIAVLGLLVAVTVATVLMAVVLGFQGAVVGTVLGDAVTVETRGADYAATAATLLLACLGVTTVLYLNIRDRGTEIATLRAIGWTERQLAVLITAEGTLLALAGTIPGVLIGLALAGLLVGQVTAPMLMGALIAWALATALASLAAYAATGLVRLVPTTDLLAE